jgi:hypothetical protein
VDALIGVYFFFIAERYATSASTSSLGSVYDFIAGLRGAFDFAVISFASVIQARMSSSECRLPTSSSGPFALPFPSMEWHSAHVCSAYTVSPRVCAAAGAAAAKTLS